MIRIFPLLFLSCAALTASMSTYRVTVDTSTLTGSLGYFDFQFNPANVFTPLATANVNGFLTNGTLNPADPFNGSLGAVSGALPGPLAFQNTSAFNDYFEAVQLGSSVSFLVTVNVPPGRGPRSSGSLFLFSVYGADTVTPLLNPGQNGEVASISLDADGLSSAAGNSFADVTLTPEPSTWGTAMGAILLMGAFTAWRRSRAFSSF